MKFERFEDILVWQKARVLVNKIYAVQHTLGIGDSMIKFKEHPFPL